MIDIRQYILSKFPDKTPNSAGKIHTYCPFHEDKHPSFSINLDKDGLFVCGSSKCGVKGNFATFYKMMENIDSWREVYERLNQPKVSKTNRLELITCNNQFREEKIDEFPYPPFVDPINAADEIDYLKDRGLTDEVCNLFGILYGKDGNFSGINIRNSLVAPIFDLRGVYKTFQIRKLGTSSKKFRWEFPSNSPAQNYLYSGWLINSGDGFLWIVEGISDVWNLRVHGIQSVGIFSSRASHAQLNQIYQLCNYFKLIPVVCLDGDVSSDNYLRVDYGLKLKREIDGYGLDCILNHLEEDEDPGSLRSDKIELLKRKCYMEARNVNK